MSVSAIDRSEGGVVPLEVEQKDERVAKAKKAWEEFFKLNESTGQVIFFSNIIVLTARPREEIGDLSVELVEKIRQNCIAFALKTSRPLHADLDKTFLEIDDQLLSIVEKIQEFLKSITRLLSHKLDLKELEVVYGNIHSTKEHLEKKIIFPAASCMSNVTPDEWQKIKTLFDKKKWGYSESFINLAQRQATAVAAA